MSIEKNVEILQDIAKVHDIEIVILCEVGIDGYGYCEVCMTLKLLYHRAMITVR